MTRRAEYAESSAKSAKQEALHDAEQARIKDSLRQFVEATSHGSEDDTVVKVLLHSCCKWLLHNCCKWMLHSCCKGLLRSPLR